MMKYRKQLTTRQSDYLAGIAAGHSDAAKCNTHEDAIWFQQVVFDNLNDSRPHYVAGYADAFGGA